MNYLLNVLGLSSIALTGWDFLIAGIIVLFVEYVIKWLIYGKIIKQEVPKAVMKIAPIVLGALFYLALTFIEKTPWYSGLAHGLFVGLTAMGSYSAILKAMLTGIKNLADLNKEAVKDINEEVKKAIEEDKPEK